MKVRSILAVLCLIAFFSTALGGYLYYALLRDSALKEVERQSISRAETISSFFSTYLQENLKPLRAMAGLEELKAALDSPEDPDLIRRANRILDLFQWALRAEVCYLMDSSGLTIASSNRDEPDSFVGENYAFRPYFRRAARGETSVYMALGVTSGKRGLYYGHPIYSDAPLPDAIGVVVVKATIEPLEQEFSREDSGIVVLTDPQGVIFASSRPEWVFHLLWRIPERQKEEIAASRQFGDGPMDWVGLQATGGGRAVDPNGRRYLKHRMKVSRVPGWEIIYLGDLDLYMERVSHPLTRIGGYLVIALCVLVGVTVFLLFRKASHEIAQRRLAEDALRQSEETAMALLNAPTDSALLLDRDGRILAANQSAAQGFGLPSEVLVGGSIFERFHPETARKEQARLERVLFSGSPLRYEEKRGGRTFDTNLYPVYDGNGKVVRVAIFSRDITERKRTEEELKKAKEELGRYSRELERQVRQRSAEINSILENTPAVVYVKDRQLRYVMVGSRFERLFRLKGEDIQGRTDHDIFPSPLADTFRENDLRVLKEKDSVQVEEEVPQEDGIHTYLSVKFPLKDEKGSIRAMCGISTDITPLKQARDQLRGLSGRVMESQEQERAVLARELHDELGQLLTALRMDAAWLRTHLSIKDEPAGQRASAMCDLIDRTIDEVRGLSIRLRPGVLDDLGLLDALEWYTGEFERRSGVACVFRNKGVPPIRGIPATAAYRIAQEALTNVARHAGAGRVEVDLCREGSVLVLSVTDNGVGFDTARLSGMDCLGIAGMRERAGLVGGVLEIDSKSGAGTRVLFRVPIDGLGVGG
ncbi:MAG: PAS domain-containing protein [Desulfobacteraceae bacterium]